MHFCYRRTIRLKHQNFSCNNKTKYTRRHKFITHKNNCCQVFSRNRNDQPLINIEGTNIKEILFSMIYEILALRIYRCLSEMAQDGISKKCYLLSFILLNINQCKIIFYSTSRFYNEKESNN